MQTDGRIVSAIAASPTEAPAGPASRSGRHGRLVAEVAADLGCDWHTVNRAAIGYGLALVDDPDRIGPVTTLGLDETAFVRLGRWRKRLWSNPARRDGQLLDVVAGRDAAPPCDWLAARPDEWRDAIEWVTFDLAGSHRAVADTMLPAATQVADPFHASTWDAPPTSGSTTAAAGPAASAGTPWSQVRPAVPHPPAAGHSRRTPRRPGA
jgi:transposase